MLSYRRQAGLEAKILSLASDLASKIRPWPQPRAFVLGLCSNFLFWPHKINVMMESVIILS